MNRTAHVAELQAACRKEMLELLVLLKDERIPVEKRARAQAKLGELEKLILSEMDEVKGNTEVRRRKLYYDLEEETKRMNKGESHD